MPPKQKVSAIDILKSGLAVVKAEGLEALTARRLAQEMGVSTAPIYRTFDSMDTLATGVMKMARDLLLEFTEKSYTDRPFLNMGTGIALFAKEYPLLYRALFLETDQFESLVEDFLARLTEDMKRDARFTALPHKTRAELLSRMWFYTHGLASMIAVGLTRKTSKEAIIQSLTQVGGAVIRDMLKRKN